MIIDRGMHRFNPVGVSLLLQAMSSLRDLVDCAIFYNRIIPLGLCL